MSSTPATNKRRFSRRSSAQPPGLPLEPSKKPREGSAERASEIGASDEEDVYVPSADPAASELSSASGAELDDDDGDSDAVGAVAARTKAVAVHNRAGGPAKWDAEAKRARYIEKYGQMSPEAALAKLAKVWRSPAYNHFKFPVIVTDEEGVVYHRFICRDHPSVYLDRISHEDSTSNLLRHVRTCEPAEMITAFAAGATYSKAKYRYLLALWCARRHRPFSVVEDPEFRKIVRMLYARAETPSRVSVSRDIQHLLEHARVQLITRLAALPGKIHLWVDGWTSPNFMSFLGVTAHWGEGTELEQVTLDFIKLNKAHTGVYLAAKLVKSLRDYGIENKVMAITCDNAENNVTMINEMVSLLPGYRGPDMRVRCFGHVLNLIVKAILSQFSRTRASKNKKKAAKTDFNAVLADLDNSADDRWELFEDYEEELIPDDEEDDGEQTDEARDEADDMLLDEIEEEQSRTLVLKKEDVLAGKQALEKACNLI